MNEHELERMLQDNYDDSREDSIRSMVSEFYSRKMLSTVIIVWVNFLVFFGLAVLCAVMFFGTGVVKDLIMYAALFVCCLHMAMLSKTSFCSRYWK